MKLVVMLMLAVFAAASNVTAASDTVTITSNRVVNTCTGEQRWLILVDIGEVYASDSLMSFDITIGYDTALIRPTDGLWSNTLAEKMKFGDISPFINLRQPGEIRVGAFTLNTPVKGDLPLFGVAGDFKGTCIDTDTLFFPYMPDFNSEFKVFIRALQTDTIIAQAISTPVNEGASIDADTVVLKGKDSTASIPFTMTSGSFAGSSVQVGMRLESPLPARIDSVRFDDMTLVDSVIIRVNGQEAMVFLRSGSVVAKSGMIFLSSITDDTMQTRLLTETQVNGMCLCSTPILKDTAEVLNEKERIVSIDVDIHAGSGISITRETGEIKIQSHHGLPGAASLIDILGRTVRSCEIPGGGFAQLSTENLPVGVYHIVVISADKTSVKKIEL